MFLTAALGIVSSWFFKFTVDDPDSPFLKDLTPAGAVGLPLTILAFIAVIGTTVWTEIKALRNEAESKRKQELAERAQDDLQNQLSDIKSGLAKLVRDPEVLAAATGIASLRNLLVDVAERIGGRPATLERLGQLHPEKKFDPDSIAVLTVFSMRLLSTTRFQKVGAELGSVLNGLESDLILLQEIRDELVLKKLVGYLPGYDYFFSGIPHPQEGEHTACAFLYRQSTVEFLGPPKQVKGDFSRPPMFAPIRIHTSRGTQAFTVANFHNKWPSTKELREQANTELETLRRWFSGESKETPILIGGTFFFDEAGYKREEFEKSGAYFPVDQLPAGVSTIVRQGKRDKRYTQFIVSQELRGQYIDDSVSVEKLVDVFPTLDEKEIINEITDHNPVSIALRLGD